MIMCNNHTHTQLSNALRRGTYIIDFDGVLVHRFTQMMDFLSARKELAKAMIECGFDVDKVNKYVEPYDLLKICYGDWGVHEKFELFSKILELYEFQAISKIFIDFYAGEFLKTLIRNGKSVYISSLQPASVINQVLRRVKIPLNSICVCGRDVGGRPKPYPDQLKGVVGEDSVVIGDSLTDGYLAKNINSSFIALDTDGYTFYELCSVGAIAVFNSLEELLNYVVRSNGHEVLVLG